MARCLRVGGVVLRFLLRHVVQLFHKVDVLDVVAHELASLLDGLVGGLPAVRRFSYFSRTDFSTGAATCFAR